jgi:hypothetical protein
MSIMTTKPQTTTYEIQFTLSRVEGHHTIQNKSASKKSIKVLASLLNFKRPSTDGRVAENKALQKLVSRKGLDEDTRLAKSLCVLRDLCG